VVAEDLPFNWGNSKPPRTGWTDSVIYEVHLRGLARGEFQAAGDLGRQAGADAGDHAAHGRVAACPAVLALQRLVDGRAGHALLDPAGHLGAVFFQTGDGAAGAFGRAQGRRHRLVVG